MNIIEINNITKIYGNKQNQSTALENINLTIKKGELVAIIGPSGAGKSTLLNILGCIDTPTSGSYLLNGSDVSKLSQKELSKVRNSNIGFIFQNFNLLYDFNLIDNVSLPLTYSKDKKHLKKRAIDMLNKVDLPQHIKKTPDKLSGGQKQRVAIARALINNPDIILAD